MNQECYQKKPIRELLGLLKKDGHPFFGDQLPKNYCNKYTISDGRVVMLPNTMHEGVYDEQALIFDSEECFDHFQKTGYFPIDNFDRDIYEIDQKKIETLNLQIGYFQNVLNEFFNLSKCPINHESIIEYYTKIVELNEEQLQENGELLYLALAVVFGEFVRNEFNGKWILLKKYGVYNPYYFPYVLGNDGIIYDACGRILVSVTNRSRAEFALKLFFTQKWGYELNDFVPTDYKILP